MNVIEASAAFTAENPLVSLAIAGGLGYIFYQVFCDKKSLSSKEKLKRVRALTKRVSERRHISSSSASSASSALTPEHSTSSSTSMRNRSSLSPRSPRLYRPKSTRSRQFNSRPVFTASETGSNIDPADYDNAYGEPEEQGGDIDIHDQYKYTETGYDSDLGSDIGSEFDSDISDLHDAGTISDQSDVDAEGYDLGVDVDVDRKKREKVRSFHHSQTSSASSALSLKEHKPKESLSMSSMSSMFPENHPTLAETLHLEAESESEAEAEAEAENENESQSGSKTKTVAPNTIASTPCSNNDIYTTTISPSSSSAYLFGVLYLDILSGWIPKDVTSFVVVSFGQQVYRTISSSPSRFPVWEQKCRFIIHKEQIHWPVVISIYRDRRRGAELIGSTYVLASVLINQPNILRTALIELIQASIVVGYNPEHSIDAIDVFPSNILGYTDIEDLAFHMNEGEVSQHAQSTQSSQKSQGNEGKTANMDQSVTTDHEKDTNHTNTTTNITQNNTIALQFDCVYQPIPKSVVGYHGWHDLVSIFAISSDAADRHKNKNDSKKVGVEKIKTEIDAEAEVEVETEADKNSIGDDKTPLTPETHAKTNTKTNVDEADETNETNEYIILDDFASIIQSIANIPSFAIDRVNRSIQKHASSHASKKRWYSKLSNISKLSKITHIPGLIPGLLAYPFRRSKGHASANTATTTGTQPSQNIASEQFPEESPSPSTTPTSTSTSTVDNLDENTVETPLITPLNPSMRSNSNPSSSATVDASDIPYIQHNNTFETVFKQTSEINDEFSGETATQSPTQTLAQTQTQCTLSHSNSIGADPVSQTVGTVSVSTLRTSDKRLLLWKIPTQVAVQILLTLEKDITHNISPIDTSISTPASTPASSSASASAPTPINSPMTDTLLNPHHQIIFRTCPICLANVTTINEIRERYCHILFCSQSILASYPNEFATGGFVSPYVAATNWARRLSVRDATQGSELQSYLASQAEFLLVQQRSSGLVFQELVATGLKESMKLLYQIPFTSSLSSSIMNQFSILDRMTIRSAKQMDNPNSKQRIPSFLQFHKIDMSQFQGEIDNFKTFNDFFYRKLRPGMRPIASKDDHSIIVSPADSRLIAFDNVQEATSVWIKGKSFTVESLLGEDAFKIPGLKKEDWIDPGCQIMIARLAPQDYHRTHVPMKCIIGPTSDIAGGYLSVNPLAIRSTYDVLTTNRRTVTYLKHPDTGLECFYIMVGATLVGSCIITAEEGEIKEKGDEFGYFAFGGSTVVLVFKKDTLQFDRDIVRASSRSIETLVQMGQSIATIRK